MIEPWLIEPRFTDTDASLLMHTVYLSCTWNLVFRAFFPPGQNTRIMLTHVVTQTYSDMTMVLTGIALFLGRHILIITFLHPVSDSKLYSWNTRHAGVGGGSDRYHVTQGKSILLGIEVRLSSVALIIALQYCEDQGDLTVWPRVACTHSPPMNTPGMALSLWELCKDEMGCYWEHSQPVPHTYPESSTLLRAEGLLANRKGRRPACEWREQTFNQQ